jgi:septation ring formation regulator EzrA
VIAKRRSPKRRKASSSSVSRGDTSPTTGTEHFVGALLEEVRGQLAVVLEAVAANGEQIAASRQETSLLRAEMENGFAQVDARFAQVDARFAQVDARFVQIDEQFEEVHGEIAEVRADLANVRQDGRELAALVARKAEGASLSALDQRVTALERAQVG